MKQILPGTHQTAQRIPKISERFKMCSPQTRQHRQHQQPYQTPNQTHPLGLSSYAVRYAAAAGLDAAGFVAAVAEMGFQRALLCENIKLGDPAAVRRTAEDCGIQVELGIKGLSAPVLFAALDLCPKLGSDYLRVVVDVPAPGVSHPQWIEQTRELIRSALPRLHRDGIHLGIENHFDLTTKELVELVEAIADPAVGLIYDSTNHLGFIEKPEETLDYMLPYLSGVHLKDYIVFRVPGGHRIQGITLGDGLLDVDRIVRKIDEAHPTIPITLELSLLKPEVEQETPALLLAAEAEPIKISLERLLATLGRAGRCCPET